METFAINSTEQYLLMAAGILLAVQIIYYLVLYSRIGRRNRKEQRNELHFTQELPPLSVIICAHDEVENLRRNLPAILAQDYPDFEVIVINDGEKNESEDYLLQLEEQYRNLTTALCLTRRATSAVRSWLSPLASVPRVTTGWC